MWFNMCSMVWYGMVWYGMVWYGMVWMACSCHQHEDGIIWQFDQQCHATCCRWLPIWLPLKLLDIGPMWWHKVTKLRCKCCWWYGMLPMGVLLFSHTEFPWDSLWLIIEILGWLLSNTIHIIHRLHKNSSSCPDQTPGCLRWLMVILVYIIRHILR